MLQAVFIDMDNTLVVNQVLYDKAYAMLSGYMRHFGVQDDELKPVFDRFDKSLFKDHGYNKERMPAAFEQTLKHFVPDADAELVETVRGFANTIFSTVATVMPGVSEAITLLTDRYPVYVVTQGDRGVQETRISHLPFLDKLAGAFIVDKKTAGAYQDIVAELGLEADKVVMIGDSLKSDVVAAVDAGLMAVWIEAHNWQLMEAAPDLPKDRAWQFSSLLETARHIAKYETPAAPILLPAPKHGKDAKPKG